MSKKWTDADLQSYQKEIDTEHTRYMETLIEKEALKKEIEHVQIMRTQENSKLLFEKSLLKEEVKKLKDPATISANVDDAIQNFFESEDIEADSIEDLVKQNLALKKEFEAVEQSTESSAYAELEIEKLKKANKELEKRSEMFSVLNTYIEDREGWGAFVQYMSDEDRADFVAHGWDVEDMDIHNWQEDDDNSYIYGMEKTDDKITFTMAGGGSHWWNYVVKKIDGGADFYKEDKNGLHKLDCHTMFFRDQDYVREARTSNDTEEEYFCFEDEDMKMEISFYDLYDDW